MGCLDGPSRKYSNTFEKIYIEYNLVLEVGKIANLKLSTAEASAIANKGAINLFSRDTVLENAYRNSTFITMNIASGERKLYGSKRVGKTLLLKEKIK